MAATDKIETTEVQGVTVVRFVDPEITDDGSVAQIGNELRCLIEEKQRTQHLLNFAGVTFLGTAMLNQLIILRKQLHEVAGEVRLCCLEPQVREIFEICRLSRVFDIADTEAGGIAMF